MTTKLEAPLKRELSVSGNAYTLTITPEGLTLVPKGRRKGFSLSWQDLVSGDAALATALNASLLHASSPRPAQAGEASPREKSKKGQRSSAGATEHGRRRSGASAKR